MGLLKSSFQLLSTAWYIQRTLVSRRVPVCLVLWRMVGDTIHHVQLAFHPFSAPRLTLFSIMPGYPESLKLSGSVSQRGCWKYWALGHARWRGAIRADPVSDPVPPLSTTCISNIKPLRKAGLPLSDIRLCRPLGLSVSTLASQLSLCSFPVLFDLVPLTSF